MEDNRWQLVVDKTNTNRVNQFFYKETYIGDESFDANSDEDTESLFLRARNLVNDEFRLMTLSPDKNLEKHNVTPKQPTKESGIKKKMESVKDERKKIQQEWDALKNASLINDDSAGENNTKKQKDPHKEALIGVVAYIEIGQNRKMTASIANVLKSMGATVVNTFAQEVTHVVYKNGNNDTFKRAKLLNAFIVSVLWVEACYAKGQKVSEKLYPVQTKSKYCHSPRVFRKYLECRKDLQLELLQTNQQKTQPSTQNEKNTEMNINPTSSNEISGIVMFKEQIQNPIAASKNDDTSSDESIRLHLSTDESKSDESLNQSTLIDSRNEADPKTIIPNRCIETKTNIESVPVNPKIISPHKRKLFDKFPLQASYISNDRESTDSLELDTNNPYKNLKDQMKKTRKEDPVKKPDISSINKPDEPRKDCEILNEGEVAVSTIPPIRKMKKLSPRIERIFKPPRSSGRSPRKNYSPLTSWPKLVSTSLHRFQNKSLQESVSKLGRFRWAHRVDRFTTHVVAGGTGRTINLLKAVARGCWVVSHDWVLQSEIAGHWVAEDIYELADFSHVVRRSRTQKQTLGKDFVLNIFDDCGDIYITRETNPPWKDLEELVILCGGKTTPNSSSAEIIIGKVENASKKCVSAKWILDCITYGRYKSISNYYLDD